MFDVAGAVLVGGRSARMGRDKALIEIGGIPMAQRVATVLQDAGCNPVFAVGPARLAAGLDVVSDEYPGEGPLGGIITALRAAAPSPVLVLACDLPWIDAATVDAVLAAARAGHRGDDRSDARGDDRGGDRGDDRGDDRAQVFMACAARREPLCAVWTPGAVTTLQRVFDMGERAVHRAAAQLVVDEVAVHAGGLINVNAPDDLTSE